MRLARLLAEVRRGRNDSAPRGRLFWRLFTAWQRVCQRVCLGSVGVVPLRLVPVSRCGEGVCVRERGLIKDLIFDPSGLGELGRTEPWRPLAAATDPRLGETRGGPCCKSGEPWRCPFFPRLTRRRSPRLGLFAHARFVRAREGYEADQRQRYAGWAFRWGFRPRCLRLGEFGRERPIRAQALPTGLVERRRHLNI